MSRDSFIAVSAHALSGIHKASTDALSQELNKNVAAGKVLNNPSVAVTFPDDGSVASQLARLEACSVTLQNFNGTGVGCPIAATNWVNLRKNITSGGTSSGSGSTATSSTVAATSASTGGVVIESSPAGSASAPAATATSTGTVDPSLVPAFGVTADTNPTGTGYVINTTVSS